MAIRCRPSSSNRCPHQSTCFRNHFKTKWKWYSFPFLLILDNGPLSTLIRKSSIFLSRNVPESSISFSEFSPSHITLARAVGNQPQLEIVDFSGFKEVKELVIPPMSFIYAKRVLFCGLKEVESIRIGSNSFTFHDEADDDSEIVFILCDCPALKHLQFDPFACAYFTQCNLKRTYLLYVL